MIRRPPRSTRTATLFPYTTLFRSGPGGLEAARVSAGRGHDVALFEAANDPGGQIRVAVQAKRRRELIRSEEHTSELQSLMRISYAVFCLKKKNKRLKARVSNSTSYSNYVCKKHTQRMRTTKQ